MINSGSGMEAEIWLVPDAAGADEDGLCSGHVYMLLDVGNGVGEEVRDEDTPEGTVVLLTGVEGAATGGERGKGDGARAGEAVKGEAAKCGDDGEVVLELEDKGGGVVALGLEGAGVDAAGDGEEEGVDMFAWAAVVA